MTASQPTTYVLKAESKLVSNATELKKRFAAALERLDGDFELLCEMAQVTAPGLPVMISVTEQHLRNENCDDAAKSLHKLKGMLSTFDSDGVVIDIQEMLELARKQKLNELRKEFQSHLDAVSALTQEVTSLADQ